MDIALMLRDAVARLPDGEYSQGLRAVVRHVDAAINHYERARSTGDDDAFTDSIYRTNQAYEGSLKEAFRAISGFEPTKKSLYDIENYLQSNQGLRERVLQQMKRYREDYRNPSTHDYKLDFDENESLLAILTVAAFSKLLVDQIASNVDFALTRKEIEEEHVSVGEVHGVKPAEYFANLASNLLSFLNKASLEGITERENFALITAFLSSASVPYKMNRLISYDGNQMFWDLVVEAPNGDMIGLDIKSSRGRQSPEITEDRVVRLGDSLESSGIKFGILIEGAARGDTYVIDSHDFGEVMIKRIGRNTLARND